MCAYVVRFEDQGGVSRIGIGSITIRSQSRCWWLESHWSNCSQWSFDPPSPVGADSASRRVSCNIAAGRDVANGPPPPTGHQSLRTCAK